MPSTMGWNMQLGIQLEGGFRPSIPFVAIWATAMVIAQMVKTLTCPEVDVAHTFQMRRARRAPQDDPGKQPTCTSRYAHDSFAAGAVARRRASAGCLPLHSRRPAGGVRPNPHGCSL